MKGFIEVTSEEYGRKSTIHVDKIVEIDEQEDGTAVIILQLQLFKRSCSNICFKTAETYAEVVEKLSKAIEN